MATASMGSAYQLGGLDVERKFVLFEILNKRESNVRKVYSGRREDPPNGQRRAEHTLNVTFILGVGAAAAG